MNRRHVNLTGALLFLLAACTATHVDAPPPGTPLAPGVRAIGSGPAPDNGPRTGTTNAFQSFTPKARGKRPPQAFRTRWTARVGRTSPRTTMAVAGMKLVIGTMRGEGDAGGVYVLDGRSGEVVKRVAPEHRDVAGVAVDGERVFFTTESGRVVGARLDGSVAWTASLGAPAYDAPALGDVDGDGSLEVVAAAGDGAIVVLDAGSGRLRYRRALVTGELRRPHAPAVAIADVDRDGKDDILAGSGAGVLSALRGRDGEPLWTTYPGAPIDAPPVLSDLDGDGALEAITAWSDGAVAIIDVATGNALWRARVERDDGGSEPVVASPVVAPAPRVGRLLVPTARADGGGLVVLAEHQRVFRADIGPVRASPVVMRLGEDAPDAIVGTERGDLVSMDGVGGFTFLATLGAPVDASAIVADFEPDGAHDIVVATRDGSLRAFATSATAAPLVARYRGDSAHNRGVVRASPLAWAFARGRPAVSIGK